MKLQDKVAIITGGGRGIGRAIALRFAEEGAKVVIADLETERADGVVAEILDAGGDAMSVVTDVSSLEQLDQMVAKTVEAHGKIDILCNNAGVISAYRDVFEHTEADWDKVMNTNLKSAFFAIQKVARVMVDKGTKGIILNTASTSAFISSSSAITSYDVSKAGHRQLTVSLSVHLAKHGIRVNAIAPGTINTEFGAPGLDHAERAKLMEKRAQEVAAFKQQTKNQVTLLAVGAALLLGVGLVAPASFMQHFIVFVLAVFVGFQVIWNVSHSLHTPLMAVTNAISSIIILGALMQIGSGSWLVIFLAALSVFMAGINIFGGFLVTRRMLAMFQKS